MNHKIGFNPLSRTSAHRRAMLRNMVASLFKYERITTTKAKAAEARRYAEKLITRAKVDTVHNRRIAAMKERNGGYTRVLKMGFRQGDAAEMVILELVDYKLPEPDSDKNEKKSTKKAKAEKAEAAKE